MSEMSTLRLTLTDSTHEPEFLQMVGRAVDENKKNNNCTYIEAWKSGSEELTYLLVSIWNSEESLMEWYRSPFHAELRKRGMAAMLASYVTYQSTIQEGKCHTWVRPKK